MNNHLRFIVKYHKSETFPGARIVGFEVEAYSVQHSYTGEWNAKEPKLTSVPLRPDLPPMPAHAPEVIFTYDCVWEHSDIAWASRWDLYLKMGDDQVHWFSILNSLVIVFLLSGIVAMIMVRTLRRKLRPRNSGGPRSSCQAWPVTTPNPFRVLALRCCDVIDGFLALGHNDAQVIWPSITRSRRRRNSWRSQVGSLYMLTCCERRPTQRCLLLLLVRACNCFAWRSSRSPALLSAFFPLRTVAR